MRRIVYLSAACIPTAPSCRGICGRAPTVGEILIDSGIETVVLQAGIVIGSGSASFEMIRHLTDRLPVMTTPKWVHNKIQPIAIDDVLHYLAEAATADGADVAHLGRRRPDVLEYGDAMQVYADVAGLRRRRHRGAAVPHADDRQLVGGPGDADPVGAGAAAGRVPGMRRGDVGTTTSTASSRHRPAG